MPIYEYDCGDCRRRVSLLVLRPVHRAPADLSPLRQHLTEPAHVALRHREVRRGAPGRARRFLELRRSRRERSGQRRALHEEDGQGVRRRPGRGLRLRGGRGDGRGRYRRRRRRRARGRRRRQRRTCEGRSSTTASRPWAARPGSSLRAVARLPRARTSPGRGRRSGCTPSRPTGASRSARSRMPTARSSACCRSSRPAPGLQRDRRRRRGLRLSRRARRGRPRRGSVDGAAPGARRRARRLAAPRRARGLADGRPRCRRSPPRAG